MTVLLSGATGFLGSHLLKRLVAEGFDVIALKRSTSDTYRIQTSLQNVTYYDVDLTEPEAIFKRHSIDIVINTVTDYGRVDGRISKILETNLIFAVKLLESAIANGVKSFINTDTLLENDINAYALSKDQLVQWMRFLSGKTKMVNVKIEHMYGPLDDDNKFIYWIIKQLQQNVEKIDLTSGVQKRDFIYISDIVEAYMTLIRNSGEFSSFEEFELGSGNAVEVKAFLGLLYEQVGEKQPLTTKLNFGAVEYRAKEKMCMQADVSKLTALGWAPEVTLQEGIKRIIDGELHD